MADYRKTAHLRCVRCVKKQSEKVSSETLVGALETPPKNYKIFRSKARGKRQLHICAHRWEVKPAMTCPLAVLVTFSRANFSVWALLDFLHAFLHWRCALSFWSLAAIPQILVNTIRFGGHPIQGRPFRQNSHVQAASRIHSERKQKCCINNLSFKALDTYHVKALLWPV